MNPSPRISYTEEIHSCRTSDGWRIALSRKLPGTKRLGPPVILIHGLGQNRFTWDLSRKSFARWMATRGVDVWILELRGHGLSKKKAMRYTWNYDTYVDRDLPAACSHVRSESGSHRLFLCGHSLGGTMCYSYAPRDPDLAGFISIAGPAIYGDASPILKFFSVMNHLPRRFGRTGPLSLSLTDRLPFFRLELLGNIALVGLPLLMTELGERLNPLQPFSYKNVGYRDMAERISYGFEKVSPGVIRQFTHWIARGCFTSDDGKTDYLAAMKDIRVPSLFIAGNADKLAPPEAVRAGFRAVSRKERAFVVFSGKNGGVDWGHLDLTMGKHAPDVVWPYILNWMEDHAP